MRRGVSTHNTIARTAIPATVNWLASLAPQGAMWSAGAIP